MARHEMWPTPLASDRKSPGDWNGREGSPTLSERVRMIPTPTAGDAKSSGSRNTPESQAHSGVSLADFVRQDGGRGRPRFPTPTVQDAKNNGAASQHERHMKPLNAHVGGALNPAWVEWLMHWPIGWTSLEPLARHVFERWRDAGASWFHCEPDNVPRTVHGKTPHRVDRLRCIGNGQVPLVAATAWRALEMKPGCSL